MPRSLFAVVVRVRAARVEPPTAAPVLGAFGAFAAGADPLGSHAEALKGPVQVRAMLPSIAVTRAAAWTSPIAMRTLVYVDACFLAIDVSVLVAVITLAIVVPRVATVAQALAMATAVGLTPIVSARVVPSAAIPHARVTAAFFRAIILALEDVDPSSIPLTSARARRAWGEKVKRIVDVTDIPARRGYRAIRFR